MRARRTVRFVLLHDGMELVKRALVVDDDDPIRHMLSKVIERSDFTVETARDGAEAIDAIARTNGISYDVILLDLMMPRVDGYSVLEYMQEHHPELLPRTIVASAVPKADILARYPELTCRVHTKPFDMSQLLDDVRSCAA
jgi:DNA-binding response OmpR family regulator